MYECYRKELFSKIVSVDSYVKEMLPINKFTYLMTSSDAQILKWVGKFVHLSFIKRVNIVSAYYPLVYGDICTYDYSQMQ